MKSVKEETMPQSDTTRGALPALLARLDSLSLEPMFREQRERALTHALRRYAEYAGMGLYPTPEETALAILYVFADYYPDDGQFTLIEQVRDMIDVHVPAEERAWLDPLKHSYMDLLEIMSRDPEGGTTLRSLGNSKEAYVHAEDLGKTVQVGQVVLARLIRTPDAALPAGAVILLGRRRAMTMLEAVNQWRREREAASGSFELGEWEEFAKRYGFILLWKVAEARLEALVQAEGRIEYRTHDHRPFLHAIALYEHREFNRIANELENLEDFHPDSSTLDSTSKPKNDTVRTWVEGFVDGHSDVPARITLIPTLIMIECDSVERLNALKHNLVGRLGYSLHFMGESTVEPAHELSPGDLSTDEETARTVVVPQDEEYRLLKALLESVYLEWAIDRRPRSTARHRGMQPPHRPVERRCRRSLVNWSDMILHGVVRDAPVLTTTCFARMSVWRRMQHDHDFEQPGTDDRQSATPRSSTEYPSSSYGRSAADRVHSAERDRGDCAIA